MKATKLGMKVFRDKQCFNTQFAHMSSVFCPDRQPPLMPLSLNNNRPSKAPFQSPIQVNQLNFHYAKRLQENLLSLSLLKMVVIPSTPTASTWHDFRRNIIETSQTVLSISLPSRNYFKVLITLTTILSGHL